MSFPGAGSKKEKNEGSGLASTLLLAGGAAAVGALLWSGYNAWSKPQTSEHRPPGPSPRPSGSVRFEDLETKDDFKRKSKRKEAHDSEVAEAIKCIVCMENPREIILMPCGHVCLCEDCTEKVMAERRQFCPVCRRQINETKAAYLP